MILSPCFYETANYARLMVESAHANNLEVTLYGMGEPFIPHGADAQVLRLCELMAKEQLAENVLVTDCRDVLFLAGESEILEKFDDYHTNVVMSTETGCWPPDPEVHEYFYGKSPHGYDFVNAGQYIGTWHYVMYCLEYLLNRYRGSEGTLDNSQGWWPKAMMRGELQVTLDSKCSIFQTMSGGVDGHVIPIGNRVVNTVTGEKPCSVHFNGNPSVKDPHEKMWRSLQ